jgi:hypothetical protein
VISGRKLLVACRWDGFVPDDGDLTDLLVDIAPSETTRRRLLVDNPTECFGFPG